MTGEISGCLRSKEICRKISSWKLRAFLTSLSFSRGVFSAHKTKADIFSSLLFASNFYLLREPFHRRAYDIKQRAQKGLHSTVHSPSDARPTLPSSSEFILQPSGIRGSSLAKHVLIVSDIKKKLSHPRFLFLLLSELHSSID